MQTGWHIHSTFGFLLITAIDEFNFDEMRKDLNMLLAEGVEPIIGKFYTHDDLLSFKDTWFPEAGWQSATYDVVNKAGKSVAQKMVKYTFKFVDAFKDWTRESWNIPSIPFELAFPPYPAWLPRASIEIDVHLNLWRNLFWLYYGFAQVDGTMLHLPGTSRQIKDKEVVNAFWWAVLDTGSSKLVYNGKTVMINNNMATVMCIGQKKDEQGNYKIITAAPRRGVWKELRACNVAEMELTVVPWGAITGDNLGSMSRTDTNTVSNKKDIPEALMVAWEGQK